MMKEPEKIDGWSKKWIKVFLCMLCTMLCYLFVLLMTISTVSKLQYEQLDVFMDIRMYRLVLFLMAVGTLCFVCAFIGFVGAWRENFPILYTFCSLLMVFSLMEGTVAFIGYTQRHKMETDMDTNLWFSINQYQMDISWQPYVDTLQTQLKCCGVQNYTDWLMAMPPDEYTAEDKELIAQLIPLSCCDSTDNIQCTVYETGCISRLYDIFYETGKTVLLNTLLAVVIQLFGAMLAFYLLRKLRMFIVYRDDEKHTYHSNLFAYSRMESIDGSTVKV